MNENLSPDEVQPETRMWTWAALVTLLQKINWLVAHGVQHERLVGAQRVLRQWCQKGPDSEFFVAFCGEVYELLEEIASDPPSPPYLEIIDGGRESDEVPK
jgi:hypothetical protein